MQCKVHIQSNQARGLESDFASFSIRLLWLWSQQQPVTKVQTQLSELQSLQDNLKRPSLSGPLVLLSLSPLTIFAILDASNESINSTTYFLGTLFFLPLGLENQLLTGSLICRIDVSSTTFSCHDNKNMLTFWLFARNWRASAQSAWAAPLLH